MFLHKERVIPIFRQFVDNLRDLHANPNPHQTQTDLIQRGHGNLSIRRIDNGGRAADNTGHHSKNNRNPREEDQTDNGEVVRCQEEGLQQSVENTDEKLG